MKKLILAISLALGAAPAAMAGFAEGATAYNNKNYSLAYKEIVRSRGPAIRMPNICSA